MVSTLSAVPYRLQTHDGDRPMTNRKLTEQKVRQVIYGGDAYDVTDVFEREEYRVAKRMLGDYVRPDGDGGVRKRAETAIEQLEAEDNE